MNESLIRIHNSCVSKNLPFVSFRLPQQVRSTTYIQMSDGTSEWDSSHDISGKTGFLMAPFDPRNGHHHMLIRPDLVLEEDLISKPELNLVQGLEPRPQPDWNGGFPVVTGRDAYMEQVKDIKQSISTGSFQKAVLSRIKVIKGDHMGLIPRLYQILCRKHPDAFVYLFKYNEHFWMGASPEPLLRLRDGRITTVSLAGTRPYAEKYMDINRWTAKEVLEQEYVTRYIHDVLHSFRVRDYRVSSPYVKKAGNLLHIRTDFSLDFDKIAPRLWEFIDAMHPTPAVAGQPKKEAIRFIKSLEPHGRDFYTGFLGPVDRDTEMDLFVNLRCMKVAPGYLSLYIGGGITLDSDPADEWDETRWKADALLRILQTYIKTLDPAHASPPAYS